MAAVDFKPRKGAELKLRSEDGTLHDLTNLEASQPVNGIKLQMAPLEDSEVPRAFMA